MGYLHIRQFYMQFSDLQTLSKPTQFRIRTVYYTLHWFCGGQFIVEELSGEDDGAYLGWWSNVPSTQMVVLYLSLLTFFYKMPVF